VRIFLQKDFFRLFVPERYGGFELLPKIVYELAIEMGAIAARPQG
jgi:hypothetical protein